MSSLTTHIQYGTEIPNTIKQENKIEGIKLPLFTDDRSIYVENPKESTTAAKRTSGN